MGRLFAAGKGLDLSAAIDTFMSSDPSKVDEKFDRRSSCHPLEESYRNDRSMPLELWSINLGQGRCFLRKGSATRHATQHVKLIWNSCITLKNSFAKRLRSHVRSVANQSLSNVHPRLHSIDLESLVLVALQPT